MKTHLQFHEWDTINNLKTDLRPKSFMEGSQLNVPWKQSGPFCCNVCGCGFLEKHKLTRHLLFHTSANRYSCDLCHQTFKYPTQVMSHKRWNHGPDAESLFCRICKKRFDRKVYLERHMNTHKPLICEDCDEEFPTLEMKYEHRKIHLKLTIYRCGICQEFYSTLRSVMRLHKLKHRIALRAKPGFGHNPKGNKNTVGVHMASAASCQEGALSTSK